MTSSLVGSEMCIRDSSISTLEICIMKTLLKSFNCLLAALGICLDLAAVSYTHLTLPTICSV
eukprot:762597-Prorocentrum_lima.AAC.1